MTCLACHGARWVCEDHPAEPWPHESCGGCGVLCVCNPKGAVEWRSIDAEIPTDDAPQ